MVRCTVHWILQTKYILDSNHDNTAKRSFFNYFTGVCHADELPIFYNIPFITREILPGTSDFPFSNSLIKLWTSFARKGYESHFKGLH
jgi:hypothetical protein